MNLAEPVIEHDNCTKSPRTCVATIADWGFSDA
jgi:hypothetical protein